MLNWKQRSDTVFSPVLGRYTQMEISHGKGCHVYDTSGKAYLDFASGIAVTSTGHCHPAVVKAIQAQAEKMIHPCMGIGYYDLSLSLAEKLVSLLHQKEYAVFFAQSGTEAVEASLKLARYTTKKPVFIAFKGGFHGRTLGALSVTTSKAKYRQGYEPLLPEVRFFDYPYAYRCPFGGSSEQESEALAIQALLDSPIWDESVAAVIIEPILGEGGYVGASKNFLIALQKKCHEQNVLLILDEIQSGIARTGSWFYYQQLGLDPDILVTAKGIASGMPLSACIAKKHLMDQWTTGSHGGTYGGNSICCAAALATLDVLSPLRTDIAAYGLWVQHLLKTGLLNNPRIGDIRVYGLMIGIELVQDKQVKTPFPELVKQVIQDGLEQGLLMISCGIHDNVLRLAPPLIISASLLQEGLEKLIRILNDRAFR